MTDPADRQAHRDSACLYRCLARGCSGATPPCVDRFALRREPNRVPQVEVIAEPVVTLEKRSKRAHQYQVMSERLRFHLNHENLPEPVAPLVHAAEQALLDAFDLLQRDKWAKRARDRSSPCRARRSYVQFL